MVVGAAHKRRDVAGQGTDRGQLAGRQPGRAGPLVPLVLLAQVRPLGQRGFPLALELAGHQPVLRLGQLILAPRPVAGEVRAFQPLPPDPVHLGPAGLGLPGGGDRQLQRGRGQRRQHLGDDMVIEEPGGHLLAARLAVGVMAALAAVPAGQPLPAGLVAHLQAVTADPAGHQPAQQRGALPRRAQALGAGPVGGQPRQVPLVLLHADIGRQRALDADQPFPGVQRAHPAGVLAAGQPPGPVRAAAPVGVDAGIGRVAQHVHQALLVRRPPDDLALARPGPLPHPDLHLVPDQEPQHRVHRAQLLEQAEHQPDDRLDLLIRIQGHLAGGPAGIPGRQRDRQLPAAGLGQPARRHPLPDQMQLDLTHRALQAQQETVVIPVRIVDPVRVGQ